MLTSLRQTTTRVSAAPRAVAAVAKLAAIAAWPRSESGSPKPARIACDTQSEVCLVAAGALRSACSWDRRNSAWRSRKGRAIARVKATNAREMPDRSSFVASFFRKGCVNSAAIASMALLASAFLGPPNGVDDFFDFCALPSLDGNVVMYG